MLTNEFTSCLSYDYDREYTCEVSGCDNDNICRCSVISNLIIETVNIPSVVDDIFNQLQSSSKKTKKRDLKITKLLYGGEVVDKYCIDRLLVANKVHFETNWNIEICDGYYGQQVGEISIISDLFEKIKSQVDYVYNLLTLSEKLKFVIEVEYGTILPILQGKNFELISIYKSQIDFKKLNQKHIESVKQKDLSHYCNYSLPRGIVKKIGDDYLIIDGYHRIISCDQKAFEVFLVID
jgi:hypothetical protein